MSGTRARVGLGLAAAGVGLGSAATGLDAPQLGFVLVLAGFALFCLTTSLSLQLQIAVGFVAGAVAGGLMWLLPETAQAGLARVEDVGWVFVRILKMLVGPLVFLAIASGLAGVGHTAGLGRLGGRTLALYLGTMAIAVLTGLVLVNLLQPGADPMLLDTPFLRDQLAGVETPRADLTLRGFVTSITSNPLTSLADPNPPILALVFFALLLGIALVQLGDTARPLAELLSASYAVVLRLVSWFVRIAPLGVMAILWSLIGSLADAGSAALLRAAGEFARFIGVVFLATGVHAFVTLPVIAWALAGVRPLELLRGVGEALMVAFTTSSSAATLPVTTRNVERMGVPRHVSSFVLPLGSTVNMDGTALYEAIAALFVAALYGIDLSLGAQLVVFGMSMLMAAGAPAIPSAGMVTMVAVLQSVGLPAEAIALLIPIDRLLDTIRTMANVEGDAVVSLCVTQAERAWTTGRAAA